MPAHIIDGKHLAAKIKNEIAEAIKKKKGRPCGLATVLVGKNAASAIYVASKRKAASEIGMKSISHELPAETSESELLSLIAHLNEDRSVDGILVQLPLPQHIRESRIIEAILPSKDVDGFHPLNLGYLLSGHPKMVACTPRGIMYLIDSVGYNCEGKLAVVVGASNIVGKPMALLLLQRNATVIICHRKTKDLAHLTRQADILVVAVGSPKLITKDHVKDQAFVVDVGINRDKDNKICGDVDFKEVARVASYITPVPGGVGPLTIAMLLKNTWQNYEEKES
ncbi:MAG TPA: bifunctional methylenetetrahydrofolate dehydrogenase/methenyltetrahydrofolate cyclohydrolase FolD [Myxococcota bacterium]|nr:bifunctional methylenetetrahydrofolate dehydrogenase/methenyltetrahydrofolate cyclohydrolase FolD [Myxococcota bacterium]